MIKQIFSKLPRKPSKSSQNSNGESGGIVSNAYQGTNSGHISRPSSSSSNSSSSSSRIVNGTIASHSSGSNNANPDSCGKSFSTVLKYFRRALPTPEQIKLPISWKPSQN